MPARAVSPDGCASLSPGSVCSPSCLRAAGALAPDTARTSRRPAEPPRLLPAEQTATVCARPAPAKTTAGAPQGVCGAVSPELSKCPTPWTAVAAPSQQSAPERRVWRSGPERNGTKRGTLRTRCSWHSRLVTPTPQSPACTRDTPRSLGSFPGRWGQVQRAVRAPAAPGQAGTQVQATQL